MHFLMRLCFHHFSINHSLGNKNKSNHSLDIIRKYPHASTNSNNNYFIMNVHVLKQ